MIECIVLECNNLEEDSRHLCAQHLKRWVQGQVYENEDGELVDHCLKNHPLYGENVRWESSGKKGKKRRRCRECLREKAQRQAKNTIVTVEIPAPYRPTDLTLTRAIEDFEEAKKYVRPKCKDDPAKWTDWGDEDEPRQDVPSEQEAAELCHGCPLQRACGNYAEASQQYHGVWGGRVRFQGVWVRG